MRQLFFTKNLLKWYIDEDQRALPWEGEKDPYKVWLREIILQQTRVEQGTDYYFRFLERFPSVALLADATEKEVLKLWEGLGYYSRCRNLMATAKIIHEKYHDRFPADYKELMLLKGIGDYTASAIASFSFSQPIAVVDGNVKRVLTRFFGISDPIDTTRGQRIVSELAAKLVDKKRPAAYNQAMMNFGATVCKPLQPDCPHCPLNRYCVAYREGIVDQLPVKTKKLKRKTRYFNYLILEQHGAVFTRQRKGKDIWHGLFEFPYIESAGRLLTKKEILCQPGLGSLSGHNVLYPAFMSAIFVQQLTHQKIVARFIHFWSETTVTGFFDADPLGPEEMAKLAFPRIIKSYLQSQTESSVLQRLNTEK